MRHQREGKLCSQWVMKLWQRASWDGGKLIPQFVTHLGSRYISFPLNQIIKGKQTSTPQLSAVAEVMRSATNDHIRYSSLFSCHIPVYTSWRNSLRRHYASHFSVALLSITMSRATVEIIPDHAELTAKIRLCSAAQLKAFNRLIEY